MSSININSNNGKYCYEYPRPALTADAVIFGFDSQALKVLLIERGIEPYKGMWALPGGFMKMDETIEQCAVRELREETGVRNVFLDQFRVYSNPDRDPRGRVVTVAFIALVRPDDYSLIAGDDAALARWFHYKELPPLAFDHHRIIDEALLYLREMLKIKPVAFSLLNEVFSIEELRKVYETINDTSYDRRNFQRKILQSDIVVEAEPHGICMTCNFTAPENLDFNPLPDSEAFAEAESMPLSAPKGRPSKKFTMSPRIESWFSRLAGSLRSPDGDDESDENEDDDTGSNSLKDQFNF